MTIQNTIPRYAFVISGYVFLLIISWMVQLYFPITEAENKYQNQVELLTNEGVSDLFFFEINTSDSVRSNSAIVLLPDVLISPTQLLPLAESLSGEIDVIIPIYPGNYYNGKDFSYSIESRSDLIRKFIQQARYSEIHLAGFGYGGLVASRVLYDQNTDHVKSILFLNSMGIQELQFLGNYSINNALYSLLVPIVKAYKYMVPHFGYYYNQPVNEDYVRSLRQKDQREADQWFRSIEIPSIVLHAKNDTYVPVQSAKEIHRLIPQSDIGYPGTDISSVFEQPIDWSRHIIDFLNSVENGQTGYRADAPFERISLSEEPFNSDEIESLKGLALLSIIMLLIFSAILHEDITCISAGLLVATGVLEFPMAVVACFIGIFTADTTTYWIGRKFGRQILKSVPFKWIIKNRDIEWAQNMFAMKGANIIFAARFIPGTRLATYFTAGILKTNFAKFIAYFIAAISIWVPLFVGMSSLIGQPMLGYLELYQDYAIYIILVFILAIYGSFKIILPLTTVKGRREFYVKWVRLKARFSED